MIKNAIPILIKYVVDNIHNTNPINTTHPKGYSAILRVVQIIIGAIYSYRIDGKLVI